MTCVSFSIEQQARRVILSHNASKPLFLYLPFQSVHGPLSVDLKYEQKYRGIRNKRRRTYAGMVDILDEAIGNVTEAMKEAGWVVNGISSLKETFHILRQSQCLNIVFNNKTIDAEWKDSRQMTSEKRANKFHTDDVLLPRSGKCFSLIGWSKFL